LFFSVPAILIHDTLPAEGVSAGLSVTHCHYEVHALSHYYGASLIRASANGVVAVLDQNGGHIEHAFH